MSSYTRGKGFLEPYLASLRARRANLLIPDTLRQGCILDIGCGSYPYFLAHTSFQKKIAIDQVALASDTAQALNIESFNLDLNQEPTLPFNDNYFTSVTLLAVVEHLDPQNMAFLFKEVYRVLAPDGLVVLTTPSAWSSGLLKSMANMNLVSKEEIDEHVYAYTLPIIGWYFGQAGFKMDKIHFGYFELFLNMWATARK